MCQLHGVPASPVWPPSLKLCIFFANMLSDHFLRGSVGEAESQFIGKD
ncbi:unnamed protein product [Cylicostephanus goldi]|uniref:Uncharacterized protein n=1 Tax=Cylicostephanus goldi TaxID=71465 RepID=A0A3P7N4B9_CYLGO|nr:unnamed protein product [Cylicostephanus goldi]